MKIFLTVRSDKGLFHFQGFVHTPESKDEFHLDPSGFYEKWGKGVPKLPHHEIEILEPSKEEALKQKLHLHESRFNQKPFVCYPLHLSTLHEAYEIFRVWCLGSVLTMNNGTDLNTVYDKECGKDPETFIEVMKEKYGIEITDEVYET